MIILIRRLFWCALALLLLWAVFPSTCPIAFSQQIPVVNHNGTPMYSPDKPFEHITLEECDGPGCGAGGTFTPAGDLSGSGVSQTVIGLQGRAVSATSPTPGQAPTWNGTAYVPATPAIASMPSASTLITDYDFHDGSGTTVSDVSGHANNMTFTNGTPGGTTAPRWVTNPVSGVGVGVAMGTDSLGSYGLPTANGGTSCETVPVLQNAARTVMIQYFNPPAGTDGSQAGVVTYTNTFAIQDFLGSSNGSLGYDFAAYQWVMPYVTNNAGGTILWSQDNLVGFHTDMIVFPVSGSPVFYHDGQPLPAYSARAGSTTLAAVNWVLGCNNGVQAGGDDVTAPSLVFRLSFWSNALNSIQAQQAYGFTTNNLLTSKGFQPSVTPQQLAKNQYYALGDSQTSGEDGMGSGGLYPFAFCAVTSSCYGTSYSTLLSDFASRAWIEGDFGMPGAGVDSLPAQVSPGLAKLRGDSNALHVANVLIGTNGFGQPPCATIENLKQAGWDVWVQLLFSLSSTPATDQANRDPYDFRELQSSFQCGATGIIDTSADGFIGADGTNGTAPPGGVGIGGVHLSPSGYAYLMSINARVLNAYYQANPSVPTVYSASSVTMNGQDRYTTFSTASNAIAASLPDCIGMVAMPYYFTVAGANAVTLTPAVVSGQTETINAGSSYVLSANSVYKFFATTTATAATAPGGCQWLPVQAPGAGGVSGSGTANTLAMFTAAGVVGNTHVGIVGTQIQALDSYLYGAPAFIVNNYSTCGGQLGLTNPDSSGIGDNGTSMFLCAPGGGQAAHVTGNAVLFDFPVGGPATAPSGACSVVGWVFSQDGHGTFCNGSIWATKI
jgi:hypothetical protein